MGEIAPLHIPGVAIHSCPTCKKPNVDGARSNLVAAVTGPKRFELAVTTPIRFVAVTLTRKNLPRSVKVNFKVFVVAPVMSEQLAPGASEQTCHWIAVVGIGTPVHVPLVAVNVCRSTTVPLTLGKSELTGSAVLIATVVNALGEPFTPRLFDAVTIIWKNFPTSLSFTV